MECRSLYGKPLYAAARRIKVLPMGLGVTFLLVLFALSMPSIAFAHAVIATMPVGNVPVGAAVTPDGAFVYVTNSSGNTVSVIDTSTNTVAATVPVGNGPNAIAVTPNGEFAYVANAGGNSISVISTVTNTVVATVSAGSSPAAVAITPNGNLVYAANLSTKSVSVIDTVTNSLVATVPVGYVPDALAIAPNGRSAYVANYSNASVSRIDTSTNTVTATVPVPIGPSGVAITPDGTSAYVTSAGMTFSKNIVSVIDTSTDTVTASVRVGNGPTGIAITHNGNIAYVANQEDVNGSVSVIDIATNTVIATVPVGSGPNGVAFTPNDNFAYVTNSASGDVSVVALRPVTTTTTIAPLSSATLGGSATIKVTVAGPATGSSFPTGTVDVTDGSQNCSATLVSGSGSCTLTPGMLTISATYQGDLNFSASSSSVTLAVNELYVALNPARLLDTRIGVGYTTIDGAAQGTGPIAPENIYSLSIAGRAGVPSAVEAVALNVTPINPLSPGYFTLWSGVGPEPNASNLNLNPGYTIPNLVISPVDGNGNVAILNGSTAAQDVVVDVQGYFPAGSTYVPMTPQRYLDTRRGYTTVDGREQGIGAFVKDARFTLDIAGRTSIPAAGVGAVVFNLTAVQPTGPGFITAWPSGVAQPNTSNLNLNTGLTIPNLAISGLGSGQISLYNGSPEATTDLVVDVQGWFPSNSGYAALTPARLLDTRSGQGTIDGQYAGVGALAAEGSLDLQVTGRGGVPAMGAGTVVLNVTAVLPSEAGYVTIWPTGSALPLASNLNLNPGTTIPNLVLAKVGSNGKVSIFNGSQAPTDILVDIQGWLPAGQ